MASRTRGYGSLLCRDGRLLAASAAKRSQRWMERSGVSRDQPLTGSQVLRLWRALYFPVTVDVAQEVELIGNREAEVFRTQRARHPFPVMEVEDRLVERLHCVGLGI